MGEVLWGVAGSDPAGIFGEGPVPDAEQAVLDLPVIPGQRQQGGLIHHARGDRGDGVDHLPGAERLRLAQALDSYDAGGILPDAVEAGGDGADADAAGFDPAVAMVDLAGAPEVGRVDGSVTLARTTGEP